MRRSVPGRALRDRVTPGGTAVRICTVAGGEDRRISIRIGAVWIGLALAVDSRRLEGEGVSPTPRVVYWGARWGCCGQGGHGRRPWRAKRADLTAAASGTRVAPFAGRRV